jgi:DNA-binding GntR family transcriptional regulator
LTVKTTKRKGPAKDRASKAKREKIAAFQIEPPRRQAGEVRGEYAYRVLRGAISDGAFKPGFHLREADVAEWLEISRTPVREAFHRIVSEGLLVIGSWNGAVVADLDPQQLVELYALREALEVTAAGLAAQHASQVEIQNLFRIAEMEEAAKDDPERLVVINADLHRAIYNAAHNRYLLQSLNTVVDTLGLLRHSTFVLPGSVQAARSEHLELLGAIRDRDVARARESAAAHINHALELRLRLRNSSA